MLDKSYWAVETRGADGTSRVHYRGANGSPHLRDITSSEAEKGHPECRGNKEREGRRKEMYMSYTNQKDKLTLEMI